MAQDLVSSVPGIYAALFGLIKAAAAQQTPAVAVYPFEVGVNEPAAYIQLHKILGPSYEWESIGFFQQKERYEIVGMVSVFSGASPAEDPTIAIEQLQTAFTLLQSCVNTPVFSNRAMPMLGTTGPSPLQMLPSHFSTDAGPGDIDGVPTGWQTDITFGFAFEAVLTPSAA
jgi:hypothetical protein